MKVIITNAVALNGGDIAILHALINVVKATYGKDTEITVYDSDPKTARRLYPDITFRHLLYYQVQKPGSAKVRKINRRKLLSAARLQSHGFSFLANLMLTKNLRNELAIYSAADVIISTGGTYLVENYNLNARIYEFDFCLALKKPLVLFTQSLGPFKKQSNIISLKKIFNQASLILLRDEVSLNHLRAIDVDTTHTRVCADIVFAEAAPQVLAAAQSKQFKAPISVGISVREWRYFKSRSAEEGMATYRNAVAAICEYITTQLHGTVTFISTCQGVRNYRFDDSEAAEKVYALLSEEAKRRTTVNKAFHTPEALKEIIPDFDVVISTRMHFAIQALTIGVPVMPIAYEFKTKELFRKFLNTKFIFDIDTMDEETAVAEFELFLETLPSIRKGLFENVAAERASALMAMRYLKEAVPTVNNNSVAEPQL